MNKLFPTLACVVAMTSVSLSASAVTLEGIHFEDLVRIGASDLKLNGVGIRAVFIIRGYVAGLYLSNKASTPAEVLNATGPKRVLMRMLREATAEDFNKALIAGIRKNATDIELQRLQSRIDELESTIAKVGFVRKGDAISLDYEPDRGTTLEINGSLRGSPIPGADFYNSVLQIFVGEHPVDARLKKGMLGQ